METNTPVRRRNTDTTAATLKRRRIKWARWAEEMRTDGGYIIIDPAEEPSAPASAGQ